MRERKRKQLDIRLKLNRGRNKGKYNMHTIYKHEHCRVCKNIPVVACYICHKWFCDEHWMSHMVNVHKGKWIKGGYTTDKKKYIGSIIYYKAMIQLYLSSFDRWCINKGISARHPETIFFCEVDKAVRRYRDYLEGQFGESIEFTPDGYVKERR